MAQSESDFAQDYREKLLAYGTVNLALFDAHDFRLLAMNAAYEALIASFAEHDIKTRTIGDPLVTWGHTLAAAGVPAIFRTVVQTGIAYRNREFAIHSSKQGTVYWDWSLEPIFDEENKVVQLHITALDVTQQVQERRREREDGSLLIQAQQAAEDERKRLEVIEMVARGVQESLDIDSVGRAVVQERLYLHQVLDQLPEGILILETEHARISYANEVAARIFGIPLATLIGNDIMWLGQAIRVATTDNRQLIPDEYAGFKALRGEATLQRESLINRPDGSNLVTLTSTVPLRSANGAIIETVSVIQDITERKSIEQQKSEFLSIASHELRTPITSIQAYAEILQRALTQGIQLDAERVLRATNVMIEQSHHLTRMIEELLELSRIETARLSLRLEEYDLIATIQSFIYDHTLITKQHSLRLTLDIPPGMEKLFAMFDKGRMEQVFNNLLSNAIKYSASGSKIEIGLRYREETAGEVLFWVKDEGIGISSEELLHIFDRFHRVSGIDQSITGFGIGLFLVKEFITRHQGRVWAESVGGQGSTFWIQLPLFPTTIAAA